MEKSILTIINSNRFPLASRIVQEIGIIFQEMDYDQYTIDEKDDNYKEELEQFLSRMDTEIECKAFITANAISINDILNRTDCLYITYLNKESDFIYDQNQMGVSNNNTVIISSDKEEILYLRKINQSVQQIFFLDGELEKNKERYQSENNIVCNILELLAVKSGEIGVLKHLIGKALNACDLVLAKEFIYKYKNICPADMDVLTMETVYELYSGNLDNALEKALEASYKYPCNGEVYFNLGSVYENRGEWFWAWVAYGRAQVIFRLTEKHAKIEKFNLISLTEKCRREYEKNPNTKLYANGDFLQANNFGLYQIAFRYMGAQTLGKYYWESPCEKKYLGIYWDYVATRYEENQLDLMHTKGEFVKVTEGNSFELPGGESDMLLPIAVQNNDTYHTITHKNFNYVIHQRYNRHFNYYRIPADSKVCSSANSYYGRPIQLQHKKNTKKLVLNLFMDGLAQCILDGQNFQKIMPYTHSFFSKGMICTRAYSAAEWTYPSLASYATGLHTTHHMMYHHTIDGSLPLEYPTLTEYFHEKGYFTAKMDGNWRDIPSYGYTRGCDQYIYKNGTLAFRANEIVGEIIDHIEAFKETDQYLWSCISELHDIADGFDMPNSVQSALKIENCVNTELGATSVKQSYSENKRIVYEKMASRIDILLNVIYQYIEENYKDEEILISLFADHGQGYLIAPGEHFCADGRARVAFMFRGDQVPVQVCDEVMSTCDYIKIMCKLADIKMKDIKIDGVLPKVFGGEGREYALMESIHPGDHYNAAIYAKDCIFYFENSFPVQDDGRFYLKRCDVRLTDLDGNQLSDDDVRYQKYLTIILEHIAPLCIYD